MSLVFIVEDEPIMAECIALAATGATTYPNDRHPTILTAEQVAAMTPEEMSKPANDDNPQTRIFNDAIAAMAGLQEEIPDVILLDIALTGPDGFTLLNELASYSDTMRIPVAIITNLDLSGHNLEHYGVFRILSKTTMTPEDIRSAVESGLELAATQTAQAVQVKNAAHTVNPPDSEQPTTHSSSTLPSSSSDSAEPLSGLAKLQSSLSDLPPEPNQAP